jgi:hypothetical protein
MQTVFGRTATDYLFSSIIIESWGCALDMWLLL